MKTFCMSFLPFAGIAPFSLHNHFTLFRACRGVDHFTLFQVDHQIHFSVDHFTFYYFVLSRSLHLEALQNVYGLQITNIFFIRGKTVNTDLRCTFET